MLRVGLDGLEDQIELIGAVDLAGYAVVAVRRDLLGFGEVVEPIDPTRRVISHDKHDARAGLRLRDQGEMIGAEVEHGWESERAGFPSPTRSAVEGLPDGLLRVGYHHSAAPS